PSNESDEFLRNRIRNTVIPALKKCDSRFDRKFTHALKNIQETNQFLQDEAQKHLIALSTNIDEHFALDIKHFLELPPIIRERVLLLWLCKEGVKFPVSKGFFSEIIRFLQQHSGGSHNMHKEWKIIKSKGKASILKLFLIM
ncbi:hypothetical protein KAH94_00665, partial [bacterium]|nr:hypothetical protein [bacterium]